MGDGKLSEQPVPSHLPKNLPGISRQLQTTPHITQNTKVVEIHGFSSNLHYCRCLIFLCCCCFWAQTTRLLELVYVTEGITLFTSADHRSHPMFFFPYTGILNIQNLLKKDGRWELANSSAFLIIYGIQAPPCQRSKLRNISHG